MTAASIANPNSKTPPLHPQRGASVQNSIWWMVSILLLAAVFRFLSIDSAPPGWRDDELIEFNMDRRIANGWHPLFISEAEGHEPVYHYLHAGTILLFGDNIVGYKWLPMASGLLTIALTFALARKMFGVRVALLAAALLAVSFWPVMYSRFGVRHIGVLPWMLSALYLLYPTSWPSPQTGEGVPRTRTVGDRIRAEGRFILAGIFLAAALMTYFAGRDSSHSNRFLDLPRGL
jgi:4-amino-4-deoxy-L-arabinose transferase-like glycosyltransferase